MWPNREEKKNVWTAETKMHLNSVSADHGTQNNTQCALQYFVVYATE